MSDQIEMGLSTIETRKIERRKWDPSNHRNIPFEIRQQIRTVMILWRMNDCIIHCLPREILFYLFEILNQNRPAKRNCKEALQRAGDLNIQIILWIKDA